MRECVGACFGVRLRMQEQLLNGTFEVAPLDQGTDQLLHIEVPHERELKRTSGFKASGR